MSLGFHPDFQPHVLIIDDEPQQSLELLISMLRGEQLKVTLADNGQQGLQYARELQPNLILLDVYMPDIHGMFVAGQLQATAATRVIPIVFLTAAGASDSRLSGFLQGGVDYIVKPFLAAEALARVRVHLNYTFQAPPTRQPPTASEEERILNEAMQIIRTSLTELPGLAELAERAGAYDKKLSAIFREHLGMSVFAWVREERLRISREWLAGSDMAIRDVATQVGFQSAANFATAFRKRMGMSPSQYRSLTRDGGTHFPNDAG